MSNIQEDDTYVLHGPPSGAPLLTDPVGQELHRVFLNQPEGAIAMIDAFTHEKLTYKHLLQRSVDLATALRHLNYSGQSTVLAISSENCLEFFIPIVASYFNCSIMAPLNHTYTSYEFEHAMKISRPKVVFCSSAIVGKFSELKKKLPFVERVVVLKPPPTGLPEGMETLEQFTEGTPRIDPKEFKPAEGDPSKMAALIMCSSGTTGLPKGVLISNQSVNVVLTIKRDPNYYCQDYVKIMGVLPFFHGFGMMLGTLTLANAQTVVFLNRFDEDVFLRTIQDYKISNMHVAPPLVVFLLKSDKVGRYDLSSIKYLLCGAAPLSKSTEEDVKKRLKCASFHQGYGLTEYTLAATLNPLSEIRPGSCGKVTPFGKVKVRDPETGRSLGPHKVGELCLKGPTVMLGYYNNEQATKETFTSDGWLKTGDLGYYDEEGYFYIVDRLKELIKFKGFQVAPAELEALLLTHPKIDDAGVVGVPDDLVGERPLAFVVKKKGASLSEQEVQEYVAGLISPQKRLSGGVIFVESIPKLPSGKILRRQLREMLKSYKPHQIKKVNSKL